MANTILLKGRGIRKEAIAGGTITPGDLVTLNSAGQLIRHATAKGANLRMFAVENDLVGKGIDDNYVVNDYAQAEILPAGGEVLAFVAAAASAIVIGDYLESDGAGGLRKLTPASQSGTTPFAVVTEGRAIAQAIQAVDNSGGAARARIKVTLL